ncbi:MAG TPA: phosphate acyltransferase PlsX [Pilimelia sp.]|nr:phosphate acyltransferase PlsX [Pilimelia sp.]
MPGLARIAVDLLGGDDAPAVVVDGALRACGADPDLRLLLVGPPDAADEVRRALSPADRLRIAVRAVDGVVGMADAPTRAIRPDTTVHAAAAAVAEGAADAVVSAGATGATVTAVVLGLGRLPDIRRPALAASLPAVAGPVVLVDVGGSVEASAGTLVRHAALGAAYARVAHGVAEPRVGLLSIGAEAGKGDRARRLAEPALAAARLPAGARFVGLVEGHEVSLGGRADVVVTDGFTGNVLLKGIEGAYAMAGGSSVAPRAAALLGVPGVAVVCHGAASAADVASGIGLAALLHRGGAVADLADLLSLPRGGTRRD